MFSGISNLFGYVLNFLYILCNQNYGFAIILFSIVLRLVLLPITIKQQKTLKKSSSVQAKIKEIQNKYKNDQQKMNKETMQVYKDENMSPFSGCFSAIIQIVIILSVFYLVSKPLTYMKKVDGAVIDNYKNEIQQENGSISNYYEIEIIQKKASENNEVFINMNFIGLDLSKVPKQNLNDVTVYIIPVLYVISSIISIKLTSNNKIQKNKTSKEEDMTQQMSKSMSYILPFMTVSIAFIAPLGLALYWFISNTLMILEKLIIDKYFESEEDKENV